MVIDELTAHPNWIAQIARWHFDYWGPLTGAGSERDYAARLEAAARSSGMPVVLVAVADSDPAGSVSLISADMSIRPWLTPWLAQLFVDAPFRSQRIGSRLVEAAAVHARNLGFRRMYLYTSGDLPRFYEKLGWLSDERVEYLGKVRTVMHFDLD